jgi:hypothetical protein
MDMIADFAPVLVLPKGAFAAYIFELGRSISQSIAGRWWVQAYARLAS